MSPGDEPGGRREGGSAGGRYASALEVVRAGPLVTIQDRGRQGFQGEGVPRGGALDVEVMSAALAAVGGRRGVPGDATIEIPQMGAVFRARGAVTVSVDGEAPISLADGASLLVDPVARAVRYVGVRGGFDVPIVLGARGTLVQARLGGFEGRALRAGDILRVHPSRSPGSDPPPDTRGSTPPPSSLWPMGGTLEVVVALGTPPEAIAALTASEYRVSVRSDRAGTRLDGPSIASAPVDLPGFRAPGGPRGAIGEGELDALSVRSRPMVPGAIQAPAEGGVIVLGPDAPTTGGYPALGVLTERARWALARARPGTTVKFVVVR